MGAIRREDISGQRFGKLVAESFAEIRNSKTYWNVRCDCGNHVVVRVDQMKFGNSRSCGCVRRVSKEEKDAREVRKRKPLDVQGRRFTRLVVVGVKESRPAWGDKSKWPCLCDCGKAIYVPTSYLTSGRMKSCGCLRHDMGVILGKKCRHGMTDTPEHAAWHAMRQRCYDKNAASYPSYGARGITVCERWHTFEHFFADMGLRPSSKHSLGRIDTNGNYEPGNCRWETQKQQQRNKRSNILLTCAGETLCMSEWAERYGIKLDRLWMRLKYGWPVELAIKTPIGQKPANLDAVRLPVDPVVRRKAHARCAVREAILKGQLIRPDCCQRPDCAAANVQAHHHNGYDRESWLDVVWLCRKHHEEADHPPS